MYFSISVVVYFSSERFFLQVISLLKLSLSVYAYLQSSMSIFMSVTLNSFLDSLSVSWKPFSGFCLGFFCFFLKHILPSPHFARISYVLGNYVSWN